MVKIKILLLIAAAVLAAANGYVIMTEDDVAPVISFPVETASYSEDMTDEELLEGVTAFDEIDGDVTDSLRIGEILETEDGSSVTIIYVARDSSNNIVQTPRAMQVEGASGESEDGAESDENDASEDSAESDGNDADEDNAESDEDDASEESDESVESAETTDTESAEDTEEENDEEDTEVTTSSQSGS